MERDKDKSDEISRVQPVVEEEFCAVYERVLARAAERIPGFAVGGSLAIAAHVGQQKTVKDLDLYVVPASREAMIALLSECGLEDYYHRQPYDRGWIYRGYSGGTIVDVIWGMPNRRGHVDEKWLSAGPVLELCGARLRILPVEELIWSKIYVLQPDRCDWPELLNLIYETGETIDWARLLKRLGEDTPLLVSLLSLFWWICPERARTFPEWLWERIGLRPHEGPGCGDRAYLLDSRPWFRGSARKEECSL